MRTLLSLLTVAALLAACSRAETPATVIRPVYVQTVAASAQQSAQQLQGTLQARHEVELAFRTGGRLAKRAIEVGQRVRAGQLLAELETTDLQLALQAADAQWQAARLDAAQQQRDAGRLTRLLPDGSVGQAEQERQRTGADAAEQRVRAAQAQHLLAQQRLSYTQLRAPFEGVITQLRLEPGQVLPEGQALLSLARTEALELQLELPEGLARSASQLQVEALGQRWSLRELAPAAHPQTRTQRARFQPSQALRWEPGLLGRSLSATLRLPSSAQGLHGVQLPSSALLARDGQAQVWRVLDDGKLQAQAVQLLGREGERVSVSGIPAGSRIVMLGAHKLDAGQSVRPVPLERQP